MKKGTVLIGILLILLSGVGYVWGNRVTQEAIQSIEIENMRVVYWEEPGIHYGRRIITTFSGFVPENFVLRCTLKTINFTNVYVHVSEEYGYYSGLTVSKTWNSMFTSLDSGDDFIRETRFTYTIGQLKGKQVIYKQTPSGPVKTEIQREVLVSEEGHIKFDVEIVGVYKLFGIFPFKKVYWITFDDEVINWNATLDTLERWDD